MTNMIAKLLEQSRSCSIEAPLDSLGISRSLARQALVAEAELHAEAWAWSIGRGSEGSHDRPFSWI